MGSARAQTSEICARCITSLIWIFTGPFSRRRPQRALSARANQACNYGEILSVLSPIAGPISKPHWVIFTQLWAADSWHMPLSYPVSLPNNVARGDAIGSSAISTVSTFAMACRGAASTSARRPVNSDLPPTASRASIAARAPYGVAPSRSNRAPTSIPS